MNKFLLCIFIACALYSNIGLSTPIPIEGIFTDINSFYNAMNKVDVSPYSPNDQFLFEISSELKKELKILSSDKIFLYL